MEHISRTGYQFKRGVDRTVTTRPPLNLGMALFCLSMLLLATSPVLAYVDPGLGSYLFQIVIAVIVSALFVLKSVVRRVFGMLSGRADAALEEEESDG